MTDQIHGACVEISGVGVLLRGPSGSGKSDLALRLIDGGASLVADDRVDLAVLDGVLTARAPANLAGMIAPMAFMDFQEVRPWAKSMIKVIEDKEMPPWHASPEFHGVFENERTMTEKEIATFAKWVRTGAARGRPEDAPAPIDWGASDWTIGEPDLIITFEEPYYVADDVEDLYQNITVPIPAGLTGDRWVKAVEFKPGSEVVHHIIGYVVAGSDAEGFSEGRRGMIGGIAPGNDPDTLPDGYGLRFPATGSFIFAMH